MLLSFTITYQAVMRAIFTHMDKQRDFLVELGNRIRRIRTEKNISQQELAGLCDFEKPNMSRIENGKTNPTIITLLTISNALGVKLNDLLGKD